MSITWAQLAERITSVPFKQRDNKNDWELIIPRSLYEDVLALPEFEYSSVMPKGVLITERKEPINIIGYPIRFADVDKITFAKGII